ncbi:MAG: AsmA-like C-terminal region-containing protein [Candidatus Brocadiia bacterium]
MSDDSAPSQRKRRWPRRLAIGLAGLLVLLVLAVVAVPLVLPGSWLSGLAEAKIRAEIARQATVQGVRFSIFSGVRVRGVDIRRREGFGTGSLARVGSAAARIDYRALLRGVIHVTELHLEEVEAHLVRDEKGVLNIQDILEQPREGPQLRLGRVVARNVTVHATDLGRGISQAATVKEGEVSALADGERTVDATIGLPQGGQLALQATVAFTDAEEFDRAEVTVKASDLAAGELLGRALAKVKLPPALAALPADLRPAVLDADLELGASADRAFRAQGTVTVRELPPIPQLAFEGPDRALRLTLDSQLSLDSQHIELEAVSRPAQALRLTAVVDPISKDKPALSLENYALDLRLVARGDLARGGLPGTPLVAGKPTLDLKLEGSLDRLAATVDSRLEGGRVRKPDGEVADLPPLALEARATSSVLGVAAELERVALTTPGAKLTATAKLRPRPATEAEPTVGAPLPPVLLTASVEADADFGKWPAALRTLLGMPPDGQMTGTVAARSTLEIATDGQAEAGALGALVDRMQAKGTLGIHQFAVARDGQATKPSDLDAAFDAEVDLAKSLVRFTDTSIRGRGIEGSLSGPLSLSPEGGPSTLQGSLDIHIAELARGFGDLVGLPPDIGVEGKVAWRLEARREGDLVRAKGTATATDLALPATLWRGEPFREPRLEVSHDLALNVADRLLTVEKAELATGSGALAATARGTLPLPGAEGEAELEAMATVNAPLAHRIPPLVRALGLRRATGWVEVEASATGRLDALEFQGTVSTAAAGLRLEGTTGLAAKLDYRFRGRLESGTRLSLDGEGKVADLEARNPLLAQPLRGPSLTLAHHLAADLAKGELAVKKLRLVSHLATVEGSAALGPGRLDAALRGKVSFDLLALVPGLQERVRELRSSGRADFQLDLRRDDGRLAAKGHVDAADAELALGTEVAGQSLKLQKPKGTPLRADLDALAGERIELRQAALRLGPLEARVEGSAAGDFSSLDARLRLPEVDLAALAALVPTAKEWEPQGRVTADLAVSGKLSAPRVEGQAVLADCSTAVPGRPGARASLSGTLTAKGSDLLLEGLAARLGDARLKASGSVRGLDSFPRSRIAVEVHAEAIDADKLLALLAPPGEEQRPPAAPAATRPATRPAEPQAPGPATAEAREVLPQCPPELEGSLDLKVDKLTHGKRIVEKVHVVASLAKSVLTVEATSEPMGGSARAEARLALGGEYRHGLTLEAQKVRVREQVDVLRKVPVLNVLMAAILGGQPQEMSFVAAASGQFATRGRSVAELKRHLTGAGRADLTDLRVVDAPLFRLLATLTKRRDLTTMAFERVEAPFTVGEGRVSSDFIRMPYEEGEFRVAGHASLEGALDYKMTVHNPKGIRFIPERVIGYLEAGNPVMLIGGTVERPDPNVPTGAIAQFVLQEKLREKLLKDKEDEGDKAPEEKDKEKAIEGATDLLIDILKKKKGEK